VLRERLGCASEQVEVARGARVGDLVDLLAARHDELPTLLPSIRVAVNQAFVSSSEPLSDGDDVALIPPVAGGAPEGDRFRVTREPLDLERVIEAATVGDEGLGGLVSFVGQVRDHSLGRSVVRLEYEAYPEMVLGILDTIAGEVAERWPGTSLAVHHRIGTLEVGDRAVVIVAAAAHRAEAFAACRHTIERIKEDCPIWKKEVGPDGASWVGMGP